MAAMGYLPVENAADDKTTDAESLSPVNHDCQPMYFLDGSAVPACFRNKESASQGNKK